MFTDERTRKITSVANPIRRKCLSFASRCLESSLTQWTKCTYRNLRSNVGLLQKILGVLKMVTNNIYISNMIFPLTFIKAWLKLMQKSKRYYWIKREESSEYSFLDSIGNLSIRSFWYHSKGYQGNPWVLLRSHPSIKRSPWVILRSHALNNDS